MWVDKRTAHKCTAHWQDAFCTCHAVPNTIGRLAGSAVASMYICSYVYMFLECLNPLCCPHPWVSTRIREWTCVRACICVHVHCAYMLVLRLQCDKGDIAGGWVFLHCLHARACRLCVRCHGRPSLGGVRRVCLLRISDLQIWYGTTAKASVRVQRSGF